MRQVTRPAFHAGAGIEENKLTLGRGNDRRDASTIHAVERAKSNGGCRDDAPGVAERNDRVRLFLFYEVNGPENGTIAFAAESLDRFVLHGEDLGGVNDLNAGIVTVFFLEGRFYLILFAYEKNLLDAWVVPG